MKAAFMLVDMYRWVNNLTKSDLFLEQKEYVVTKDELAKTIASTKENYKDFVLRKRLEHFGEKERFDTGAEDLLWFAKEEDYAQFQELLDYYSQQGIENPLMVGLNYLLNQLETMDIEPEARANLEKKLSFLFSKAYTVDEAASRAFYEKNETRLQKALGDEGLSLKARFYQDEVVELVNTLQKKLGVEKNPLQLLPLLVDYYYDAVPLAAFLLWLNQTVGTDKLISSGVFHDFFEYHYASLGEPNKANNPFFQVHGLLEVLNPELRNQVETISACRLQYVSESKNKHYLPYSLTGKKHPLIGTPPQTSLKLIQPSSIEFAMTIEDGDEYFQALHGLFGDSFLLKALIYFQRGQQVLLGEQLKKQLNGENQENVTALLINQAAKQSNGDLLLEVLATLLDEQMITRLIKSEEPAVVHLAPYKPVLLKQLSEVVIQGYLEKFKNNLTAEDSLFVLSSLLKAFEKEGNTSRLVDVVYENFLAILLANTDLHEDEGILDLSKQYKTRYGELLLKKAQALDAQLTQAIEPAIPALLSPEQEESKTAPYVLKDTWLALSRQFRYLKKINPDLLCSFPENKYELIASLVKHNLSKVAGRLKALLTKLTPLPESFDAKEVTEFERALIEMLAAVNDEAIRSEVIQLLENPPISCRDWMHKIYGAEPLFILAARNNNITMMQFLLEKEVLITHDNNNLEKLAKNVYYEKATLLYLACKYSHNDIKDLAIKLLKNPATDNILVPFHKACEKGYTEIVTALLKQFSININKADHLGSTPLFLACANGHKEIVITLLKQPSIEINKKSWSKTPLSIACFSLQCDKELFTLLLVHGVSISSKDVLRQTALDYAVLSRNEVAIGELLLAAKSRNLPVDLIMSSYSRKQALLWSNEHAQGDLENYLQQAERTASEENNQQDSEYDWNTLMKATQYHPEMVAPLLKAIAVLDKSGHKEAQQAIFTQNDEDDWNVAAYKHSEIIKPLLKTIAALDKQTQTTRYSKAVVWSALMMAAFDHPEILEPLLNLIAALDIKEQAAIFTQYSEDGRNALMIAARFHPKIVEPLLKAIAALDIKEQAAIFKQNNERGFNALMIAALYHPDIVEPLLNAIAMLDIKEQTAILTQFSKDYKNALMIAAFKGFTMAVEKLSRKIDPGTVAANGVTVMFIAAQNGHFDIVQWLFKQGVNHSIAFKTDTASLRNFAKKYSPAIQQSMEQWIGEREGNLAILPKEIALIMGHNNIALFLDPPQIREIHGFFHGKDNTALTPHDTYKAQHKLSAKLTKLS